jgi:hypothetical protein
MAKVPVFNLIFMDDFFIRGIYVTLLSVKLKFDVNNRIRRFKIFKEEPKTDKALIYFTQMIY